MTNDDLTPQEKRAIQELPREQAPSAMLKARTVRSLRQRGVLRDPHRRYVEVTPLRAIAAAAACVVLVAGAFAFGQRTGLGTPPKTVSTGSNNVAATVQQAGTAHVKALEDLGRVRAVTSNDAVQQGREVALNALYAVAQQTARLVPDNDVANCIRQALHEWPASSTSRHGAGAQQQVIWF